MEDRGIVALNDPAYIQYHRHCRSSSRYRVKVLIFLWLSVYFPSCPCKLSSILVEAWYAMNTNRTVPISIFGFQVCMLGMSGYEKSTSIQISGLEAVQSRRYNFVTLVCLPPYLYHLSITFLQTHHCEHKTYFASSHITSISAAILRFYIATVNTCPHRSLENVTPLSKCTTPSSSQQSSSSSSPSHPQPHPQHKTQHATTPPAPAPQTTSPAQAPPLTAPAAAPAHTVSAAATASTT